MSLVNDQQAARSIRRRWTVGGVAGATFLVVAWYLLCCRPVLSNRDAARREVQNLESLIQSADKIRQRHSLLAAESNRLTSEERNLRQRIASQPDEEAFLSWASAHAHQCGLSVNDFRPAGGLRQGEYEGRSLRLSGTGSYVSICRFLDLLRHCPRMNRVSSFDITPRDAARASYLFNVQVVLFSFPKDPPTVANAPR